MQGEKAEDFPMVKEPEQFCIYKRNICSTLIHLSSFVTKAGGLLKSSFPVSNH